MEKVICPGCGRWSATERELAEFTYEGCGLPRITLHGGAFETSCTECSARYYHVAKEGQLLQLIALTLLTSPNHLLGPEMRFLRGACELSQQHFAGILKCRRATVAEREAARQSRISEAEQVWIRLVLLREFRKHLERWPDRNFLCPSHMDRLDAFEREFSRRALEMARRAIRLHRQVLRMHPDGTWGVAEAA